MIMKKVKQANKNMVQNVLKVVHSQKRSASELDCNQKAHARKYIDVGKLT